MGLVHEDSPVYAASGASVLASLFLGKDKVVRAMRGDGGNQGGPAGRRQRHGGPNGCDRVAHP